MTEDDITDLLYRAGEWECIKTLVADREEMTVYLKVEAALNELEALRDALSSRDGHAA